MSKRTPATAKHSERRDKLTTSSHIEIKTCYGKADTTGQDPDRDLGQPGEFPYTRGVYPTMYRSRLGPMRQ